MQDYRFLRRFLGYQLGLLLSPDNLSFLLSSQMLFAWAAECSTECDTSIAILLFLRDDWLMGVADLGYEGLNMQVRETSIHKTSGFSSYFFHTLIKQRRLMHAIAIHAFCGSNLLLPGD